MAHTLGNVSTRASVSANPSAIASFALAAQDTVLCLLLKVDGATDRAGGAPVFAGQTMAQASTTQKAASLPEAGCELWYLTAKECGGRRLPVGTFTGSIPNTGSLTIYYTLITGRAAAGCQSYLDGAVGANGTSANPSAGAYTCTQAGNFAVAVFASGITDADPAVPSHTGFGTGTGTPLGTFDDGAHGGGQQYGLIAAATAETMLWTLGSDDWGCVAAFFKERSPVMFNNYLTGIQVDSGGFVTEKIR